MTREELAKAIDEFTFQNDPGNYMAERNSREEGIAEVLEMLKTKKGVYALINYIDSAETDENKMPIMYELNEIRREICWTEKNEK